MTEDAIPLHSPPQVQQLPSSVYQVCVCGCVGGGGGDLPSVFRLILDESFCRGFRSVL